MVLAFLFTLAQHSVAWGGLHRVSVFNWHFGLGSGIRIICRLELEDASATGSPHKYFLPFLFFPGFFYCLDGSIQGLGSCMGVGLYQGVNGWPMKALGGTVGISCFGFHFLIISSIVSPVQSFLSSNWCAAFL
ncbi:uncharacterized protein BCR38DRAFT_60121 [Pseudomassariella vexata]|uniref:Uncharacterized protein n=1 Tax=Pseudomassariella vexata TaxID=1141098 RepID=A0A1Y2DK31_9PEZI|nr:uncharacterized protein BCR38DRAFT_60121 [Pseudomassariella vexata]ORY59610.1 hypothetical protein BCR38DRAFT_60121 [Pseudomassariella vexata]